MFEQPKFKLINKSSRKPLSSALKNPYSLKNRNQGIKISPEAAYLMAMALRTMLHSSPK